MFTDLDYRAAALRNPVRHLNESIERATKAGLTLSARIEERQPVRIIVEAQATRSPL